MTCSIIGLGTALPPESVSQEDAMAMSAEVICENPRQRRILSTLFRKAGVKSRRTAIPWRYGYDWKQSSADGDVCLDGPSTSHRMELYREHAPGLAMAASRVAIEEAGVDVDSLTHLVTVSCTGFSAPGVDIELIQGLGMRPTTERVHVGYMGCHGSINGLRTVRGLVAADPAAKVLMCSVELCSLHYRMRWDEEGIVGNALFADGAAALVATGDEACDGAATPICDVHATGACLIAETTEEMSWQIGDHGFQMRLTGKIPESIREHLKPWIDTWLAQHGHTIDSINQWIVHPGGPKIIDAVEQSLGLDASQTHISRNVLEELGNMSSATVLFILQRVQASIADGPAVVLAFGPGVMAEAVLLMPA